MQQLCTNSLYNYALCTVIINNKALEEFKYIITAASKYYLLPTEDGEQHNASIHQYRAECHKCIPRYSTVHVS